MYNLLYEYSVFCNGNEHQMKKCNIYNLLDREFFFAMEMVINEQMQYV